MLLFTTIEGFYLYDLWSLYFVELSAIIMFIKIILGEII